ncbi:MAG: ABC transporter substrate-binding protein [Anaerolineales bacterium]|nr:ABC transporter substrate-binding protein [Anaerolineales bacterium]
MKRNSYKILLAILLIAVFILSACNPAAEPEAEEAVVEEAPAAEPAAEEPEAEAEEVEEEEPVVEAEPILIGWMGAASGPMAMLGEWDTRGILLAFEEVNANGGIAGRMLELVEYDDEADPTKAVGLAEKLITEDGVVAAFATTNSTPTLAVVPIFAEYQIPHITGGINDQITQEGSAYVFRDTAAGWVYETTIVDYVVSLGYESYAIIADNSAYGQGEADAQEAALAAQGLEASVREIFAGEDTDFTGQLTKILAANPEVLLCASSDVACGLVIKQARGLGFEGLAAGPGSLGTAKFIEVAGEAAEGTLYSAPYISNEMNDITLDWAARYEARWDDVAESHGAKAYDGAMVLIMAIEACAPDNINGVCIAEELHNVCGYQGLQGEFCFDETGEGMTVMNIGTVQDGELTAVQP